MHIKRIDFPLRTRTRYRFILILEAKSNNMVEYIDGFIPLPSLELPFLAISEYNRDSVPGLTLRNQSRRVSESTESMTSNVETVPSPFVVLRFIVNLVGF